MGGGWGGMVTPRTVRLALFISCKDMVLDCALIANGDAANAYF